MKNPALENERGLLGAMLASKEVIPFASDKVRATDFRSPVLAQIYTTTLDLWERGEEYIDPMVVTQEIGFDNTNAAKELTALTGGIPSSWEYHADKVRDSGARWRLQQLGQTLAQRAESAAQAPEELIGLAEKELASVATPTDDNILSIRESLDQAIHNLRTPDKRPSIPTGFTELDDLLNGGLKPGQMVIVAGRPGMGKSTFGVDVLRNACIRHNKTGLFFSLEMGADELTTRILAAETNTRLTDFVNGNISEQDWELLQDDITRIGDANAYIDDTPGTTMQSIRARARQMEAQGDLDLIVVDYLQLLTSGKKVESRQQEVSEFSRQIKLLAKECDVPVIAIAQLNRGSEMRDNGVPKASDLRESGSLEQDADIIILINRPGATNPDHERAGEVDFIVAKHRAGRAGTVTVADQLHYAKFTDPVTPAFSY